MRDERASDGSFCRCRNGALVDARNSDRTHVRSRPVRQSLAASTFNPKDANVSTDLGVSYYYSNDADRALQQFEASLRADPKRSRSTSSSSAIRIVSVPW